MALLGPNAEDLRKIHAEVNQLVNQRFVLTTVAITVFGFVMAWMLSRISGDSGAVGAFVFVLSAVLSGLLFALFVLSHLYKGMIRVYSTYLKVTGASQWEEDWSRYRQSSYLGYTKPQTIVFLVLNGLTVGFPFLIGWVGGLRLEPRAGWITSLGMGLTFEALMIGMGFKEWWDREKKAENQWLAIRAR
jgi:Na+/melibiose symporter-like transporter